MIACRTNLASQSALLLIQRVRSNKALLLTKVTKLEWGGIWDKIRKEVSDWQQKQFLFRKGEVILLIITENLSVKM